MIKQLNLKYLGDTDTTSINIIYIISLSATVLA